LETGLKQAVVERRFRIDDGCAEGDGRPGKLLPEKSGGVVQLEEAGPDFDNSAG